LRTNLKWSAEDVMDHAERLFSTRDITRLNPVMGEAFIAYLRSQNDKAAA
jgi:DNA topoisomerase IA